MLVPLLGPSGRLPPAASADEDGLVAATTDLSAERLLEAYSQGIFPWFEHKRLFYWFSPDPRMVLYPDRLRVPRRLRRTIARGTFEIRLDTRFHEVTRACASVPRAEGGTWITPAFRRAYGALHEKGLAHSVEAWLDGTLVGGLYGVALGAAFMGESMFTHVSDASKVAFVALVGQLRAWGFFLVDCQVYTPHLERFGAEELPRGSFLDQVQTAVSRRAESGPWRIGGSSPIVSQRESGPSRVNE